MSALNDQRNRVTREYVAKMKELGVDVTRVNVLKDGQEVYKSETDLAKALEYEAKAQETTDPDLKAGYKQMAKRLRGEETSKPKDISGKGNIKFDDAVQMLKAATEQGDK